MKGHIAHKGKRWYPVTEDKDEAGKRKRRWHRGFSTKKEAQKYLNELLHKIEIGTYVAPSKITLADFLKQWLNDYAKVNTAPRTYEGYERIINQHLIPCLGKDENGSTKTNSYSTVLF